MAVRKLKPVTPGQRHKIASKFENITRATPEKSLIKPLEPLFLNFDDINREYLSLYKI